MKRNTELALERLTYYAIFLSVMGCAVWAYFFWLDSYRQAHPQIIEASAAGYVEEQPLEGILLWDEQLIYAPQDGVYTYLSPKPRMVSKGEALAALDGTAVRAPYPGYFYPALDGQEGRWVYSRLWPDFAPFPFFRPAILLENGIQLRRGAPIGKIVPQPQDLRCIAYLNHSPSLERTLKMKNSFVKFKMAPNDKERKAEVVAIKSDGPFENIRKGHMFKVYLRLPFFPPSVLKSRAFSASIVAGEQHGVMVPDSAVITAGGKNFVFLLQGNQIVSRDVDGFPADDRSFFIIKGVAPGNSLILDAKNAREGTMRI